MAEPASAELPQLEVGDFAAFFAKVHGHAPFPWQTRLAERVAQGGGWPRVLDLPTGSGKTAAIDVAVFHLALQAGVEPRTAPLRIVYVVDRRTIVDQAHERAHKIREALAGPTDGVVATVRARLESLGRDAQALRIAVLRGGIARSDSWARSPDQPLIAVSTVDQVGSRLLFRGYGVSDSMKPVHAGLLGNDVLYLLDEVHLSEPFRETLAAVAGRYRGWAECGLPSRFDVVEMSATPGHSTADPFRLDDADEANDELRRRLDASKPTELCEAAGRKFFDEIERRVKPLVTPGATVAVVVNRVASARELHARLAAGLKSARVELVTGRMRPLDRDALEGSLFERLRAGRIRDPQQQPVVVVATQCIEAGADFDFDALVTECASLDALRQRFGRLDRLGRLVTDRGVTARGVIVARTDTLKDDPVYGEALGQTFIWLSELAAGGAPVDFGIRGLEVPADARERGLLSPRQQAPVLLPSHLDSWVQTAPKPEPDPDLGLWLHGPERGVADVQVVWRADLTEDLLERAHAAAQDSDDKLVAAVIGRIEALPPASGEAMSVPLPAVRRWLDGRSEPDTADVEGGRFEVEDQRKRKERERPARVAVAWRGSSSSIVDARGIRPGDTLVVPATYGGIAAGTWAPAASAIVRDWAELAVFRQRGRAVLRLVPEVLADLLGASAPSPPVPAAGDAAGDGDHLDDREQVLAWLDGLMVQELGALERQLIKSLRDTAARRGLRVERLPIDVHAKDGEYFLVSSRRRVRFEGKELIPEATTEDDRGSFTGVKVALSQHLQGVAGFAGDFAARVGLPPSVTTDVRLAGLWHDAGKADPRFQRWLHGGSEFKTLVEPAPLAKSAVPINDWRTRRQAQERSGYPRGARHEVLSVALMESATKELQPQANDWDLVLHLVASHHGQCRPLAPWAPDAEPVVVSFEHEGVACASTTDHHLERLDSGVAERFWRLVRRYGWWGLAWLEAILRLGDHRRSEEEQRAVEEGA